MAYSELQEVSPIPIGNSNLPSLEEYVSEAAYRGFLGVTNANRLLAARNTAFSDETEALLWDIAAGKESDHPQFDEHDFVAPLLRSVDCFDYNDHFLYNEQGFTNTWEHHTVFTKDGDFDAPSHRGTVIFKSGATMHEASVAWPALLPVALHDTLWLRKHETDTTTRCIEGVATLFFELSYYDPQAGEQTFQNAIEESLDRYHLK